MGRKPRLQRINFDVTQLDMPLVVKLGYDHLLEPISLKPHAHESPELTFVLEGEATWVIRSGEKMSLTGGSTSIIQPHTIHHGEWEIITPSALFWIVFEPSHPHAMRNTSFTRQSIQEIVSVFSHCGNTVRSGGPPLIALYQQLRQAISTYSPTAPLARPWIRNLLAQIIILSAGLFRQPNSQPAPSKPSDLTRVFAFMKQHLHDTLSVHDLADFAGMSVARFNDFFKHETGLTPADYYRRLKCIEARNYLATSSKSITEIAFLLSFSTSQHFASVFRKYTGLSPRQYRQQTQQRNPQK